MVCLNSQTMGNSLCATKWKMTTLTMNCSCGDTWCAEQQDHGNPPLHHDRKDQASKCIHCRTKPNTETYAVISQINPVFL